ncbi:MAG: type II toxin-antitoxin system VapC family toxin [Verrucomicrobiota bacterium]|jgi:predicted nucleic acid-binding protein
MFLLDTAAVSELDRPKPNPGVVAWFSSADWIDLYLSVISVAEIWQGIARLPAGRKRRSLEASFDLIPDRFPGRVLAVDYETAVKYGELQAKAGPLPVLDTLIGATALVHRLTVITRNTADMARTGALIHDPWI